MATTGMDTAGVTVPGGAVIIPASTGHRRPHRAGTTARPVVTAGGMTTATIMAAAMDIIDNGKDTHST